MTNRIEAKPVVCKRCGHSDCAWVQSKAGKFYLVEGGLVHPDLKGTAKLVYSPFQFHKCLRPVT
mgnify:CR=1 FL=1